ncbi:hypothetical protein BV898_06132 [Hypsibius exemplaris]|uniref:Uncharacterized protein n=1 Tax=Hypsibius exemplaris TaxID=2072580 RepID=A0A1W0WXI6_HYPEX|nr:hypothetical protein BV898_06132 [Hypsibius exemplaris]
MHKDNRRERKVNPCEKIVSTNVRRFCVPFSTRFGATDDGSFGGEPGREDPSDDGLAAPFILPSSQGRSTGPPRLMRP